MRIKYCKRCGEVEEHFLVIDQEVCSGCCNGGISQDENKQLINLLKEMGKVNETTN